jgi:peptide/nickel transport system substrate-binding protein
MKGSSALRMAALAVAMGLTPAAWAYQEAPQLAEAVAAGTLPPVDERLPVEPMVVEPEDSIGKYGGTMNFAVNGPGDWFIMARTLGYEPLVRWNQTFTEIVPNVAKSFEVNDTATEFTFVLREGMKWSDGVPFTADDVLFWYDDIVSNPDIFPGVPARFQSGGVAAKAEKVDDYTVKFVFEKPNGLFLQAMAYNDGEMHPTMWPKHYLSQFHIKYNSNADAEAQAQGHADWVALMSEKSSEFERPWRFNPEVPVLNGWTLQASIVEGSLPNIVAERNPYYWKVDPEGNQLPYVDALSYAVVQGAEVILLKALNGEIDLQDRNLGTNTNRAVLFDGQEAGGYHFYEIDYSDMNTGIVALNLTHPDDAKREIFQNKDFRIALSHAINRQEIIDLIHIGVGEPWQAGPKRDTPFFNETLAKQYTEFDPAKANGILDGILPMGADGVRTLPDGSDFVVTLEVATAHGLSFPDVAELVTNYWRGVGLNAEFRVIDRSLLDQRRIANQIDGTVWRGSGGGLDAFVDPRYYIPVGVEADFGVPWALWYAGLANGIEPPEAVKEHLKIFDELQAATTTEEQNAIMTRLLETSQEMFYAIGISTMVPGYGVVANELRNVPEVMPGGAELPNPAPSRLEQMYWDVP